MGRSGCRPTCAMFDQLEVAVTLRWLVEIDKSGVFLLRSDDDLYRPEALYSLMASGQVAFWRAGVGFLDYFTIVIGGIGHNG